MINLYVGEFIRKAVYDMEGILVVSIAIGIAFLAIMYIPALMIKRAMIKIIRIFCSYNAIGARNAKTIDELGLRPPDFLQRLVKLRDYKPYALQILEQTGIVKLTHDGKLYMKENKLEESLKCNRDLHAWTGG